MEYKHEEYLKIVFALILSAFIIVIVVLLALGQSKKSNSEQVNQDCKYEVNITAIESGKNYSFHTNNRPYLGVGATSFESGNKLYNVIGGIHEITKTCK